MRLNSTNRHFSFNMQPENELYQFSEMNFHWRGSEHQIDDLKYAAELQLFFKNQNDPNKISIIAFLIKVG